MKILIIAGGTGSIAIQSGLQKILNHHNIDGFDVKVLTNAYDNGLSTGAVRVAANGKILGPSDVRKNQTTALSLRDPDSEWLKFLNIRFTKPLSEAKDYCNKCVSDLHFNLKSKQVLTARKEPLPRGEYYKDDAEFKAGLMKEAIDVFFNLPSSNKIDYTDFSLANIIYAGLAVANGNSLRKAATIMAKILEIPDNVILNDDTSLFLGAVTKSGQVLTDEGDIVFWGKQDDSIKSIFFKDADGLNGVPVLCEEARQAIINADLIILSTGTQWSSLIPTYYSAGFSSAIAASKAEIVMVMNRVPDSDSPGQTSADIVANIVPKYFPKRRIRLIMDDTANESMQIVPDASLIKSLHYVGKNPASHQIILNKVHNDTCIARAILAAYFDEYLNSNHFVFDYDDTLVARGNQLSEVSKRNMSLIANIDCDRHICTGNSIKALNFSNLISYYGYTPELSVFADGGINQYTTVYINQNDQHDIERRYAFISCIDESALVSNDEEVIKKIVSTLCEHGIKYNFIENRNKALIAIKPVPEDFRQIVADKISDLLVDYPHLTVRTAGRSTIEIVNPKLSKMSAINHLLSANDESTITFVGDEFEDGNDKEVFIASKNNPRIKFLGVKTPAKTMAFLTTLSR